MTKATYFLTPNASGTAFTGSGYTPDGTLPTGAMACTQAQAQNFSAYALSNGAIVSAPATQLLAQAQAAQIAIITQACAGAITGGFSSSALGSAHTYPSGLTDQANLAANVVSSLLPGLPSTWTTPQICSDANGVWAYVAHTAAQIQQVGSDGKAAILASLAKKASLQAEIEAATTVAAVQAIVW